MSYDGDDKFLGEFEYRMKLEPNPEWTRRQTEFPWLEIGWAFAAALMLALYWSELKFGFLQLAHKVASTTPQFTVAPIFYVALGGLLGLWFLIPKRILAL